MSRILPVEADARDAVKQVVSLFGASPPHTCDRMRSCGLRTPKTEKSLPESLSSLPGHEAMSVICFAAKDTACGFGRDDSAEKPGDPQRTAGLYESVGR